MQNQSDAINELIAAMNRAQLAMSPAKKERVNPFFSSHYADLPAVWDALLPFRREGLVFTQSPAESPDGYIILDTQIAHTSGQWMRSRLKMRLAKDDPQGAGSALTYARRYALGCMSGLVTEEDDDGNAASVGGRPGIAVPQRTSSPVPSVSAPAPAPAPAEDPNGFRVPFGKNKGKSLRDVPLSDVDWLARYYTEKLNDPAQATSRYREEWSSCLAAVEEEQRDRAPLSILMDEAE